MAICGSCQTGQGRFDLPARGTTGDDGARSTAEPSIRWLPNSPFIARAAATPMLRQPVIRFVSELCHMRREAELDAVLKQLGATHLIVTGGTTSVCVESTIRDAYRECRKHSSDVRQKGRVVRPCRVVDYTAPTTSAAVIGRNDGVASPAAVGPVQLDRDSAGQASL